MKEYLVWIDEEEKIVSFHEVDNSELIPIIIGLQMYDLDMYHRFVTGNDSTPMKKILMGIAKPFATFRYYCLMCVYARLGLTVTGEQCKRKVLTQTRWPSLFETDNYFVRRDYRIDKITCSENTQAHLENGLGCFHYQNQKRRTSNESQRRLPRHRRPASRSAGAWAHQRQRRKKDRRTFESEAWRGHHYFSLISRFWVWLFRMLHGIVCC